MRLKLLAWLAGLVFVAGCGGSSYGASKARSSLALTPDAANATYSIEGRPVALTNGDAGQPAALSAAKGLRDEGVVHATVDNAKLYRVRSAEILLKEGVDWFEATEEHRRSDAGVRLANFVTAERI